MTLANVLREVTLKEAEKRRDETSPLSTSVEPFNPAELGKALFGSGFDYKYSSGVNAYVPCDYFYVDSVTIVPVYHDERKDKALAFLSELHKNGPLVISKEAFQQASRQKEPLAENKSIKNLHCVLRLTAQ